MDGVMRLVIVLCTLVSLGSLVIVVAFARRRSDNGGGCGGAAKPAPVYLGTVTCSDGSTAGCTPVCDVLPPECVDDGCVIRCPGDMVANEDCPQCKVVCPENTSCERQGAPVSTSCTWDCGPRATGSGPCVPTCQHVPRVVRVTA
jgi:hypothetical protein